MVQIPDRQALSLKIIHHFQDPFSSSKLKDSALCIASNIYKTSPNLKAVIFPLLVESVFSFNISTTARMEVATALGAFPEMINPHLMQV